MLKFILKVILFTLLALTANAENYLNKLIKSIEKHDTSVNFENLSDVILVLGNDDNDKTIFTKRIAGREDYYLAPKNQNSIIVNESEAHKTIYANLVEDSEKKVVYYDCPGFKSVTNALEDVKVNFFIDKFIQNSKRFKLIFLAKFSSIQNASRGNFEKLLKRVASFLKNINDYENNVVLIVHQVNLDGSNEITTQKVSKLLKDFKSKINSKNIAKLIDVFIREDNNKYPNLGVLRSPDKSEEISDKDLINSKITKLKFATSKNRNMGNILLEETKEKLSGEYKKMLDEMYINIKNIIHSYQEYFEKKAQNTRIINVIVDDFERAQNFWKELYEDARNNTLDAIMINDFILTLEVLKIPLDLNLNKQLSNYVKITEFFRGLHDEKFVISTDKFQNSIKNYVEINRNFLIEYQNLLYYVNNFSDYEKFNKMKSQYKKSKQIQPNRVNLLNDVFSENPFKCSRQVTMTGYNILLSEIFKKIQNCAELEKLNIFAYNKIFIDASYTNNNLKQITFFAPNIEVIHLRKVDVSGKPGINYANSQSQGNNDGMPGDPGSSGANAIIAAIKFINGKNLTIISNGGKGGTGGNGSDNTNDMGGLGGKGGVGGYPGTIKIINLGTEPHHFKIINNTGAQGASGIGGMSKSKIRRSEGINNEDMRMPRKTNFENQWREIMNFTIIMKRNCFTVDCLKNAKKFAESTELHDSSTFTITEFINEVNYLESLNYDDHVLIPLYESFLKRVQLFIKDPRTKRGQYQKILMHLYTVGLTNLCKIKNKSNANLIIDLETYLELVSDNIKMYKELLNNKNEEEVFKIREALRDQYHSVIDVKTNEANAFIQNELQPSLEEIFKDIKNYIDHLICETKQLQRDAKEEQLQLERMKRLRLATGILNIFGNVLCFFGPIGTGIDVLLSGGTLIASAVLESQNQINQVVIPDGVKYHLELGIKHIDKITTKAKTSLQLNIKNALKIMDTHYDELNNEIEKFHSISRDLDTVETPQGYSDLQEQASETFKSSFDKLLNSKLKIKKETLDSLKNIEKIVSEAPSIFSSAADVAVSYIKTERLINQAGNKLEAMVQFEKRISENITPMIESVKNYLQRFNDNLNKTHKNHIQLDVSKWNVKQILTDMKNQLSQATRGFKIQQNLVNAVQKLDDLVTTIITVYDHIDTYRDNRMLIDYIHNMISPQMEKTEIIDPKLKTIILNLDIKIKSNIIVAQYEGAANAYKSYVFPHVEYFLDEFPFLKKSNETALIETIPAKIAALSSKLKKSRSIIDRKSKPSYKSIFAQSASTTPFYVWKNFYFNNEIAKLLSGQEITLRSYAEDSTKNAVKFKKIKLHFKAFHEDVQNEINEELRMYAINITHFGNSYYRCGENVYMISRDSVSMDFNIDENGSKMPTAYNNVYEKLAEGDPILSPYTLWSFKLMHTMNKNFDSLKKFIGLVDLHLNGEGTFQKACDSGNLTHYYQAVENTYSIFSNM